MPTYDYNCEKCGSIELYRPIDQRNLPGICPDCGIECERVFTMPSIRTLDPGIRKAIDRNIQSRFEPKEYNPAKGLTRDGCPPSHRPKKPRKAYGGARSWVMESARSSL